MNKKIILSSLILGLSLFIFPVKALAADLTVTCNGSSCSTNGQNLFAETNIAPGFSATKDILVDNSADNQSCNLYLQATRQGEISDPDLASQIMTILKTNGVAYFGDETGVNAKSMAELFGQMIYLGTISANSTQEVSWRTDFDYTSDDTFQAKTFTFNFNLAFTCGVAPTNTVTPSLVPTIPAVLGISTDNVDQITTSTGAAVTAVDIEANQGNVLGLTCENNFSWWIVLLVQVVLTIVVLVIKTFKQAVKRLWMLFPAIGVVSQLVQNYLGCGCSTGVWCGRYIYLNIAVMMLAIFMYWLLSSTKSDKLRVS